MARIENIAGFIRGFHNGLVLVSFRHGYSVDSTTSMRSFSQWI